MKIVNQLNERNEKLVKKSSKSFFQKKLDSLGIKWLTALRFQLIRYSFIIVISGYYISKSIFSGSFNIFTITLPPALYLLTEPTLSFSITSLVTNSLLGSKQKKKMTEVFTLFDLLKADLNTMKKDQQVNIYNILRESTSMFEHINGTLARLLSLWKTNPQKAKDVLYEEIGGESTKILGEIIYRLDKTSKNEAMKIIESEAAVFTFTYYENEMQQGGKKKMFLFSYFTLTTVLIIAWLIAFVYGMFSNTISGTSI